MDAAHDIGGRDARLCSGEPLTPVPASFEEVTRAYELRGSMYVSSLASVRDLGLLDAYLKLIPEEVQPRLLEVTPATWVPVELIMHHYRAMDRLFPDAEQQRKNGRQASEKTQSGYLKTIFRVARAAGHLDPAVAASKLPTAFSRLWNGGMPTAYRMGPKDVRIELLRYPIATVPYSARGWAGMFEAGLAPTAKRVYVRVDEGFRLEESLAFDVSWV